MLSSIVETKFFLPEVDPLQVGRGSADIRVPPAAARRRAHLPPRHGHRAPQQDAIHSKVRMIYFYILPRYFKILYYTYVSINIEISCGQFYLHTTG